jgi:hypothetical protein
MELPQIMVSFRMEFAPHTMEFPQTMELPHVIEVP